MDSFVLKFKGEIKSETDSHVVKLSKKLPILQALWISAGYENVTIKRLKFSYKSRCPKAAQGVIELTVRDLRLEDQDDQIVASVSFDVKDWVELTWSYPVWFHSSDFSSKHDAALDMHLDVIDSNMLSHFSMGSFVMKVHYQVQNQITKFRPTTIRAVLVNQTASPGAIITDRKQNVRANNRFATIPSAPTVIEESSAEAHKDSLIKESVSYLASVPRIHRYTN